MNGVSSEAGAGTGRAHGYGATWVHKGRAAGGEGIGEREEGMWIRVSGFLGLGAHLGLESPLQGAKGDGRREARRQAGHGGREGRVRLWREGTIPRWGRDAAHLLCPAGLWPPP